MLSPRHISFKRSVMLILVLGNVGNSQSISQVRRDGCSRAFAWASITISLLIRVFLRPPRHECGHTVLRFFILILLWN